MEASKHFEEGLAAGEAAASTSKESSEAPATTNGRMYVRTQGFGSTDAELRFLQRCGVKHKAAKFPFHPDKGWVLDELIQEREHHESFGFTLDMSSIPILEKLHNIIYFGKSPERDREIDLVCEMIRTASRAGIDSLRYNTCILPIDRTEKEEGRGGYTHTAFRLDKISKEEQNTLSAAGRVTAEMHWERIEYLLERIIPVADEFKVRLGNSQEDPPTPPGYKGVDKVLNDFEGMKRFIETQRSPYHGWNFCVGSIAEMLEDSATEVFPFIEYFGSRNTIFLVHYRNLMGKRYSFREALPDEGDMDFCKVLKALKDVGYCYGIDPDHVPRTEEDPKGYYQSYAYCFGYINAMIQAVYATP
ncbi:MAG: mannonate dehydratase [Candidatus Latescibacteria bacterium]|nr:mannonate dehydratase [Candidatus Latescibacterota bacterium]MBT4137197.1 mannonate dehydratase [Candidatus Latescibacterota bacterium]